MPNWKLTVQVNTSALESNSFIHSLTHLFTQQTGADTFAGVGTDSARHGENEGESGAELALRTVLKTMVNVFRASPVCQVLFLVLHRR